MPDRNAKLSITTELEGTEQAAAKTRDLKDAHVELGDAAGKVSAELQDTAVSVERVADAERAAAGEAENARVAIADMGATSASSSSEIVQQSAAAAAGVAEIGDAAAKSADETAEAAKRTEELIKSVTSGLRQQFESIRSGGGAFTDQLAALRSYEAELQKIADEHEANGNAAKGSAEATQTALADVRKHIAEVTAELKREADEFEGLSATARAALGSIEPAVISVDQAITIAAQEVAKANEQFKETGRIAPRQLGFVVQAVESVRLAQMAQGEVGEQTAAAQVAAYKRLEGQLVSLTSRANALTNAARDNAVGLKETGNRIAGVGLAVQDLGRFLGPTGEAIGNAAARLGLLGANIEQAKDALHGLNVNQLGAAKGALGLGVQIASAVAVFAAAAAATAKLSSENQEYANTLQDVKKWLDANLNPLEGTKSRLNGLNEALPKLISNWQDFTYALAVGNIDVAEREAKGFTDSLLQLAIGVANGRTELDLWNISGDANFKLVERMALTNERYTEVLKFYRQAQAVGTDGQALWSKALAESGGTAAGLEAATRRLNSELKALGDGSAKAAAEAKKLELAQWQAASSIAQMQKVVIDAKNEIARFDVAINGTTVILNDALRTLAGYVEGGKRFSVEARIMADATQTVLDRTRNLSDVQRANIQAVIDAALENDKLTESERRYVEQLASSIIAGQNKTASLRDQIVANTELQTSIQSLLDTVREETSAQDERATAIGRAAAAAEEELAANEAIDPSRRAQLETIISLAKEIDVLNEQQKASADRTKATADAFDVATEASDAYGDSIRETNDTFAEAPGNIANVIGTLEELNARRAESHEQFARATQEEVQQSEQLTVVLSGQRQELQNQIEEKKRALEVAAQQVAANDALVLSTEKVRVASDGTGTSLTNTANKLTRLKDEAVGTSETVGGVFVNKLEGGRIAVSNLEAATDGAGITLGEATKKIERTGEAADAAAALMRDQFIKVIADVRTEIQGLSGDLDGVIGKFGAVASAAEAAAGDG